MKKFIFLLFIPFTCFSQINNYVETCDNDTVAAPFAQNACCAWSQRFTHDTVFKGTGAAVFHLRHDDPPAADGTRSEWSGNGGVNISNEQTLSYAVLFPSSSWAASDPIPAIVTQFHVNGSCSVHGQLPSVTLQVINDSFYLKVQSSNGDGGSGVTDVKFFNLGKLVKDRWRTVYIHVKFSYQNDGLIELELDGNRMITYVGPNRYNDACGAPYPKIGLYIHQWVDGFTAGIESRTIYFDQVQWGHGYRDPQTLSPFVLPAGAYISPSH